MPKKPPVLGFHFICRRDLNVTQLPDGEFDSGNWAVDESHAETARHVALHEKRSEPSYLQGELISLRPAAEKGRFVFRVRATPTPYAWPARSGAGEKAYCRADEDHRAEVAGSGRMYECEVKRLFKQDGKSELRWTVKPVSSLGGGPQRGIRCMHCHGEVRIHKQDVGHGPADHVEHMRRADAINCRGGKAFGGTHHMSNTPIA